MSEEIFNILLHIFQTFTPFFSSSCLNTTVVERSQVKLRPVLDQSIFLPSIRLRQIGTKFSISLRGAVDFKTHYPSNSKSPNKRFPPGSESHRLFSFSALIVSSTEHVVGKGRLLQALHLFVHICFFIRYTYLG